MENACTKLSLWRTRISRICTLNLTISLSLWFELTTNSCHVMMSLEETDQFFPKNLYSRLSGVEELV
jgi:hypothetical protein